MSLESVLRKANLTPKDIVVLEPDVIAERLHQKAGIQKDRLPGMISNLFESTISSDRFEEAIPPGLAEGTVDCLKVLLTARFANKIGKAPTIAEIAKFSGLSRNFVSPCVRFLENVDLVKTKQHMRGQLVNPTRLTTRYIDVISGSLRNECNILRDVAAEAKRGELSSESLQFLDDLETAFHISKLAHNKTTVNYEIMEDLHDKVRSLVVKAKEGKNAELMNNLNELIDLLEHMISVTERAKKMGVRPAILEETGEKLGRARVFRVK